MNYKLIDQLTEAFIAKGFKETNKTDYVTAEHIVVHTLFVVTAKTSKEMRTYTIDIAEEYAGEITYIVVHDDINICTIKPHFGMECDDIVTEIMDLINGDFMPENEDYQFIQLPDLIQKHLTYHCDGDKYITYYYVSKQED